jgi:hypothetical protein
MKRHRILSLRQPECVSVARIKGFKKKKENVSGLFDILEKVVDVSNTDAL